MKKVLLITYYWPPAGGGGVQRWLKMSPYFKEQDIELIIYTPKNPEYPELDTSLLKKVDPSLTIIKHNIWEPYSLYKTFLGRSKKEKVYSGFINDKKSIKQQFSVWLRGNFFIPDARKFWIKPSIKYLSKYLDKNPVDAIISTGPPHSMHMIALGLKKKISSLKWIADFRDPWTNIDFYDQLKLSSWADKKHHAMEREVLTKSDKVVAVGWTMAQELEELGAQKVSIIPNGFDHRDFEIEKPKIEKNTLVHLGSMNKDRNPEVLWKALAKIKSNKDHFARDIKVKMIGVVDHSIEESIEKFDLKNQTKVLPFVAHSEAIETMMSSDILLLVINNTPNATGILTGKLFEYMGAQRPILCIGPREGDTKRIIDTYPRARYVAYDEVEACVDALEELMAMDEKKVSKESVMKYSRKNLTKEYSSIIKSIT